MLAYGELADKCILQFSHEIIVSIPSTMNSQPQVRSESGRSMVPSVAEFHAEDAIPPPHAHTENNDDDHFDDLRSYHSFQILQNVTDSVSVISHNGDFLIPDPPFENLSTLRKLAMVFLIIMTQLLTQASLSQSIVPYHYIARSFGVQDDPGEVSWMSAAFSLTVGTFILIAGRVGDLLGYKRIYIGSYINLAVWSTLAGVSKYSNSIEFFDVCRGMQGLSLAFATPNALAIIGHYFPDGKQKIFSFAMFAAVAPGGFFIGALWDALFVQRATWNWMFYIMAIVSLLISIAAYFIFPKNIGTHYPVITFDMYDPLGCTLGVVGLVLINFAFNQGPVVGWEKPYVYILLIVGILAIVAFVFSQKRVKYPLIPPLNFTIVMTLAIIAAGWSSFGIWIFYLLKFSLDILHQTPIVVAVQFAPTMIAGLCASLTTGVLVQKIPTSIIILFSTVCFTAGLILNGLRPVSQVYWIQRFLSMIITPFAMDTSFPAGQILLANALPREHQGVAGSLIATVVNYSIAIGLGVAGTVEYYTTKHGATMLQGIRNAGYTGMGFAGFAVLMALSFNAYLFWQSRRTNTNEKDVENDAYLVKDSDTDTAFPSQP